MALPVDARVRTLKHKQTEMEMFAIYGRYAGYVREAGVEDQDEPDKAFATSDEVCNGGCITLKTDASSLGIFFISILFRQRVGYFLLNPHSL
jgi:hypothetical protein